MKSKILDNYPNYCIWDDGVVWNISGNKLREIYGYIHCETGYKRFCLYDKNRKQKTLTLHQLLALSFIPNPENLKEIDHIDGDKLNNSLSNLRWVTPSQNNRNKEKFQRNENTPQSGFKYVTWDNINNKWKGNLTINGEYIYIGRDEEPEILYIKCLKKLYELSSDYDLQFECNTVKDDLMKYRINEIYVQY